MERWAGRVAVVTGASAGIGAAIAYQLQDAGVDVVALARRKDKIQGAVEEARRAAKSRGRSKAVEAAEKGLLHPVKCDVTQEEDILAAFKWVEKNTKGVDILVNNAGIIGTSKLSGPERNTEEWRRMLDINVLGLSICTREAVQHMKARGVEEGHVVHISSNAGHSSPEKAWPGWAMYHASKHAVRVLTEGLRKELIGGGGRIRVTEISPGLVRTDIVNNIAGIDTDEVWKMPHMYPEDIAAAVLYAISAPPDVQIHDIIMRPTLQDY